MGDLVLLETEINPVMLKLIEGRLEITAVHNHLLRANPATFYMHVGGHGDPVKMAAVIRGALAASKTPLETPAAATPPPAVDLDTAQLDQLIQRKIAYFFTRAGGLAGHLHALASTKNESKELCKQHAVDAQKEINGLSELADDLLRDLRKLVSKKPVKTISRA